MRNIFIILVFLFHSADAQHFDTMDIFDYEKNRYINNIGTPDIFYPGDSTIDITFYKLDLNINYQPNYLSGEVVIGAKSKSVNLSSLFIDLSSALTVDSVLLGGTSLNFDHSNDMITIYFPNPVNRDEQFYVTVFYQGVPVSGGFGSFTFGDNNGKPSIYSLSEPYGAKDWWPCKDTPADKADSSEVWLTVREDLTAVSNGRLIEVQDNGNTKTYKWKHNYPVAHYLISVAVSVYTEYIQYFYYPFNNSMPVTHYIYPEYFEEVKPELDKTINMLSVFSELFGAYPFLNEKYGHAQFGWGGGMEHQTISSMGSFNENIISHELAHQWFGNKITCRDWHNIWLNEGFATYATALYYEKVYGNEAYKNYIEAQIINAKKAEGSLYVQDISSIYEIFNGVRSYSKGAVVLHMLRGVTGDSIFFDILKQYADHPSVRYNSAATEDFLRIAESVFGNNLEYFFTQWVYGTNYPRYKAGWRFMEDPEGTYRIILDLEQQENNLPSFFTMPLQVRVATASGDTSIVIFNNRQVQQFNFNLKEKPLDLIIDPDNLVMKEILYTNSGGELLPEEFTLQQNYPNPFNSSTIIRFAVPTTQRGETAVQINLYDITGSKTAAIYKGILPAGIYSINFNTSNISSGLSSGIYVYTLESEGEVLSRKMCIIK